ncbi:MAG: PKD domain-containing protein, partial [Owenweeksia sp.]
IDGVAAACPAPSTLAAGSITCNQAGVSWTAGSASTQSSIVEYGTAGFTPGTGTIVNTTSLTVTLTGLQPGTNYSFYVRDVCSNGDTSAVAGPFNFTTASGPLNASFTYTLGGATMTNRAVTFTDASAGATSWSWNFGDGGTSTMQNPVHSYTQNGGYQVTLTITGPCGTATFQDSVIIQGISVDESSLISGLAIFPNPTSGKLYIENNGVGTRNMHVEIFALNGKLLMIKDFNGNDRAEIDMTPFARGFYNVKVTTDQGVVIRRISRQ